MTRAQRLGNNYAARHVTKQWMTVSESVAELHKTLIDKVLICRHCGKEFTFGIEEQQFYRERGLTQPQRCPACRAVQRAERNNSFRNIKNSYIAKCTSCGKETAVPFIPQQGRPIYCKACWHRIKHPSQILVR